MTTVFTLIGCAGLAFFAWLFCVVTAPYKEHP